VDDDERRWSRYRREVPIRPFDVAVTAALAGVGLSIALALADGGTDRLVVGCLVVAHVAPLLVRRRWPIAVLAAMAVTGVLTAVVGFPTVVLGPAVLVAVFTVASVRPRSWSLPAVAVAAAAMVFAVAMSGVQLATVVANLVVFAAAWFLGDRGRLATERADQAERGRDEASRQAAAEERLRIARELHDIVAHTLSVIAVQAGTGRVVIDTAPDTARQALAAIESTSRGALDEMRRLLTVLRTEHGEAQPLSPSPGLADLDALVASVVGSDLPIEVRVEGERTPLPAGVDLAAYRIVQEALTNVRKHARASKATVIVRYEPDALRLEVLDDGRGGGPGGATGHGLVGMRERASLYGGSLDYGTARSGGFRVVATIPRGRTA
jgi:signal transduction histidine kinase